MKLFTPGPSNVPEFVLKTYEEDCFHHRKGEFHALYRRTTKKLKQVFQMKGEVVTLTCSGTGVMEASVLSFFEPGDEVLVINTGVFGQRFVELGHIHGLDVKSYQVPMGETYKYEEVRSYLDRYDFKGVFMTFSETSTGMLNEIKPIHDLIKDRDCLLIVDAISGLVLNEFKGDEWGVDVCLASSQKGFLLPPGISFVGLSQKALDKMRSLNVKSMYFDLNRYVDFLRVKAETPFTPGIFLLRALDVSLDHLLEKGLDTLQKEKEMLKNRLIKGFGELGFVPFGENTKNNTLVSFEREDTLDLKNYVQAMEKEGLIIAAGQLNLQNKIIRVGLISEFVADDIDELIEKTKIYLEEFENGKTV